MSAIKVSLFLSMEQLEAIVKLGNDDAEFDSETILSIVDLAQEALENHKSVK